MRSIIARALPSNVRLALATVLLAAILTPPSAEAQMDYTGPDGRYSVEIPEGLTRVADAYVEPGVDAMFERTSAVDPADSVTVAFLSMGGELPNQRAGDADIAEIYRGLPDVTHAAVATLQWLDQTVNTLEYTFGTEDGSRFVATAQMPVRDDAVQIVVGSPVSDADEARALLGRIVGSFDAEARWAMPVSASDGEAPVFTGPDRRYTIVIPDGMTQAPPMMVADGIDALFQMPSQSTANAVINVNVLSLEAELGRRLPSRAELEGELRALGETANLKISPTEWRGHSISTIEYLVKNPGVTQFVITAALPIQRQACRITAFGVMQDEAAIRDIFAQVLSGAGGDVRWAAPPSPAAARQQSQRRSGPSTGLLVVLGVLFIGGLISAFELRRRLPRGLLLILAFVLVGLGFGQAENAEQPVNMLVGSAIQLLGFVSIFIGIADLFIRRPRRDPAARRAVEAPAAEPPSPEAQRDAQ